MYVVVQHQIKNPQAAFARGEKLIKNEGAPAGVSGLQFYPSQDGSAITCLWEAPSVGAVQEYVDSTLGDSSENLCYAVDTEQAFARQPWGLPKSQPSAGSQSTIRRASVRGRSARCERQLAASRARL